MAPLSLAAVMLAVSAPLHAGAPESPARRVVFRPSAEDIERYARQPLDAEEPAGSIRTYKIRLQLARDGKFKDAPRRGDIDQEDAVAPLQELIAESPRGRAILQYLEAMEYARSLRDLRRYAQARLESADKMRALAPLKGPDYREAAAADKAVVAPARILMALEKAEPLVMAKLETLERRMPAIGPTKSGRDYAVVPSAP